MILFHVSSVRQIPARPAPVGNRDGALHLQKPLIRKARERSARRSRWWWIGLEPSHRHTKPI